MVCHLQVTIKHRLKFYGSFKDLVSNDEVKVVMSHKAMQDVLGITTQNCPTTTPAIVCSVGCCQPLAVGCSIP